jgi:hypothetical protein
MLIGYITKYPFAPTKEHWQDQYPPQEDDANIRAKETSTALFEDADWDLPSHP